MGTATSKIHRTPPTTHATRAVMASVLMLACTSMALTKQKYNFIVGVNGDFKAALAAASSAASSGKRFYIFFPDGEYDIGSLTGNSNQMTTFTTSNVSFIGQSSDKTVVYNKSVNEGISITATLFFSKANNLYLQDLTLFNKAVYGNTAQYNVTGRHVVVQEQGDKIVYKNVKLKSTQDTYYTKGTRTYWEGGEIHGTTDFICGGGDVYFNKVLIWEMKASAITAPSSTNATWGYVFKDCTVDGTISNGSFTLGRSWNDARAVFINTTMNKLPSTAGWGDPMNSVPKVFAEYKSKTSSGSLIDLSGRRKSYTKDATTVTLNPVLSDAEAAKYTLSAVLGGTDNWQPQNLTAQIAAPVVRQEGNTLKWDDNANALCWVVFKGGKYLANVTTNSFDGTSLAKGDVITVRAANEMGGLGPSSNSYVFGTTTSVRRGPLAGVSHLYDRVGKTLRMRGERLEGVTVRLHALNGSLVLSRTLAPIASETEVSLGALKPGIYLLRYGNGTEMWEGVLDVW